ncbi:sortase [Agrococcus sp. SL85]|uniref:class F sortase n=1 Tax=Agrococcus sp. SL85 TaxID=2995141 RepID=UPI00226CCB60|nr:class F sortase [Agrococcus sp. SL85]WAC66480.1 sortase [Agrococcus sp. SL85]
MMQHIQGRRHRIAVAAALLLASAAALAGCSSAPAPAATEAAPPAVTTPAASPAESASPSAEPSAATLPASRPTQVSIERVGLDTPLIETGMRADGSLEVPPGEEGSPASWYDGSPTPGERGTSVLLGHVDSLTDESGAFFELHDAQPGDVIDVLREDGTTASFEIYRVDTFEKDDFPTREVYFPASGAELRLITCDDLGQGDGTFPNNFIAFASLVEG